MTKSPLGGGKTGPNPTDRGKSGVKRSLLTEAGGIPVGLAVDGANRHDMKLVRATVDSLPVLRPDAPVGTVVRVEISGVSGGRWEVAYTESGWVLWEAELSRVDARVSIDEIDAWKVFTKSLEQDNIKSRAVIEGDLELGLKALETVSIIA